MCRCLFAMLMPLCLACGWSGEAVPQGPSAIRSLPPCLARETIPTPSKHPAAPVRAVFIDLDGSYDWKGFLRSHSVDVVVVQNIIAYDEGGRRFDNRDEAIDLVDDAAAGLQIYMGLVFDERFYPATASKRQLDQAAVEDVRTANEFWARLTTQQRSRITGWYLAREIFNFRPPAGQEYRKTWVKSYLAAATTDLPGPQSVLISPYFVPPVPARTDLLGVVETADLFAYLVASTGVDGVLLQDGTGARNDEDRNLKCEWSLDDYLSVAAHYASSVARRLPPGVTFWSNVEAFGKDATPDRLNKQLSVTPVGAPVIVFAYRQCSTTGTCRRR